MSSMEDLSTAGPLLGESTTTSPDLGDEIFNHDEFFQDKEHAPVSEFSACKEILYTTAGETNVKIFDICLLVPSLVFLFCLIYTSPRSRQKLSGAPTLVVFLQFLIFSTTVVCLLRSLLMIALPTHKDSHNFLEKVSWTLTRSSLVFLELTVLLNLVFTSPPNTRNSRRLLAVTGLISIIFFVVTLLIELVAPSAAYRLFEKGYYLYGDGGALYAAMVAGVLAVLHSTIITFRCRQHKSIMGRRSGLCCSGLLLVIHALRAVGGLALFSGLEGGFCLTSITLYVHTAALGPIAFFCVIIPFLREGFGHSLLAYSPQLNNWEDEDIIGPGGKLGESGFILKNENTEEQPEETD